MVAFFSNEYFSELATRLQKDPDWVKGAAKVTAKLMMTVTDRNEAHLFDIVAGNVTVRATKPDEPADFKFEGPYDAWTQLGRGERDFQGLVLGGKIRFRGSMPKIMALTGQLNRITQVAQQVPKEF